MDMETWLSPKGRAATKEFYEKANRCSKCRRPIQTHPDDIRLIKGKPICGKCLRESFDEGFESFVTPGAQGR